MPDGHQQDKERPISALHGLGTVFAGRSPIFDETFMAAETFMALLGKHHMRARLALWVLCLACQTSALAEAAGKKRRKAGRVDLSKLGGGRFAHLQHEQEQSGEGAQGGNERVADERVAHLRVAHGRSKRRSRGPRRTEPYRLDRNVSTWTHARPPPNAGELIRAEAVWSGEAYS